MVIFNMWNGAPLSAFFFKAKYARLSLKILESAYELPRICKLLISEYNSPQKPTKYWLNYFTVLVAMTLICGYFKCAHSSNNDICHLSQIR